MFALSWCWLIWPRSSSDPRWFCSDPPLHLYDRRLTDEPIQTDCITPPWASRRGVKISASWTASTRKWIVFIGGLHPSDDWNHCRIPISLPDWYWTRSLRAFGIGSIEPSQSHVDPPSWPSWWSIVSFGPPDHVSDCRTDWRFPYNVGHFATSDHSGNLWLDLGPPNRPYSARYWWVWWSQLCQLSLQVFEQPSRSNRVRLSTRVRRLVVTHLEWLHTLVASPRILAC